MHRTTDGVRWTCLHAFMFFLLLWSIVTVESNAAEVFQEQLITLQPPKASQTNLIRFSIPTSQYQRLRKSKGEKFELEVAALELNGQVASPKSVKLHGQTTLHLPRKSLRVSLEDPVVLPLPEQRQTDRRFYLLSLSMDRNYYQNAFAFGCMNHLDFFELYHTFTALEINGTPQGIYMLVQRPRDYATQTRKALAVLRRGYQGEIEVVEHKKKAPFSEKEYEQSFQALYQLDKAYTGEALYHAIAQRLDIQRYLRWLAFNYFIQNGDYTDELYLFAEPEQQQIRFQIIPWDYDDIFSPTPHEGQQARTRRLGDKLLYSSEDPFDRTIANDAYLYAEYLKQLARVLQTLTPEVLRQQLETIYQQLYPYYTQQELIDQSQFDTSGQTNLMLFERDLEERYRYLVMRRMALQNKLAQ